ncbi:hypothetical protein IW16_03275 [Chryseobacterium vrystaatense]|uniref:Secreted protein n=1 Tax=Chryseobacterium vrystaatense TaxID=307480 RepID=A0ABR4USJ5_9FLAO|nr:hypothetical protein IW16_03275 [Chryseobacterium vrystaatense]
MTFFSCWFLVACFVAWVRQFNWTYFNKLFFFFLKADINLVFPGIFHLAQDRPLRFLITGLQFHHNVPENKSEIQ